MKKKGVQTVIRDNAVMRAASFKSAQKISDGLDIGHIHKKLDNFTTLYCPVIKHFPVCYHLSIMQAEYATNIIFKRQKDLQLIYKNLTRTAIHSVKPENIATFPGKKLSPLYKAEMGNNFYTRIVRYLH